MSYSIKYSKIPTIIIYSILIVLPFIQLGNSYYGSVFFITFITAFLLSLKVSNLGKKISYLIFFGCLIFLFKATILYSSLNSYRESLVALREMFCFIGLFLLTSKISKADIDILKIGKIIIFYLLIILIFLIIQNYFLSIGKFIGFPIDMYAMNQGTLTGIEKNLLFGNKIRPSAFYAEPSYCGWIVFSLLTITLARDDYSRKFKLTAVFLSFSIVLISNSFAGIVALIILIFFYYYETHKEKDNILLLLIAVCIILPASIFLLFSTSLGFRDRILNILSNSDTSYIIRITEPLTYIQRMTTREVLFGVNNYTDIPIDNAALGLIIHYGLLSIFFAIILSRFIKHKLLTLYFFVVLSFNGSIFSFDKILIISLVLGLSKCFVSPKEIKLNESK